MNKIIYWILAASTVLIGLNSCKENPWDDVTDGGWNHERTILDIKLEGQVGVHRLKIRMLLQELLTLRWHLIW